MVMRRTAQGRLSEIFGRRTLRTDTLLRRLDIYSAAKASVVHQDDRTLDALEAYAAGINARISEINMESLGRGAPEFFLFEAEIAPWQPADSLAIIKLMALQLSGHIGDEVLRARTSLLLGDEARLSDILPEMPGSGVAALPQIAQLLPGAGTQQAQAAPVGGDFLWPVPRRGLAGASNVWAAAPERSASRGTLLANDPHLGFTAPSIWYLARMELQSGGVIGASIPGIPALMVGRSRQLAWGITSSYLDDQDLFFEEINPDNRQEYRTPDGFKPFETRQSIIRIKDEPPVTLTLLWTDNGPVLPSSQFNLDKITPPGHLVTLSWTALSHEDTSASAAVGLMMAGSVEEGMQISRLYVAPSQNLTMIDGDTVAMKLVGAMPRRDPAHESLGRLPSRGWIATNRWDGYLPYSSNPEFLAPEGGIVGNTNNKMIDRPFPNHVSFEWGDSQRVQRWTSVMQGRKVHTRDSFIEAQLDTVSPAARTLLPLIGRDLWFTGEAAPQGTPPVSASARWRCWPIGTAR